MKKPRTKKLFPVLSRGRIRRAMKSEKAFNKMMVQLVGKENVIKIK